jgi:hypothetical protein
MQRCTQCGIDVAADADRCPQCLRKSTLVDPHAHPEPLASPWDVAPPSGPPSHAGIRFLVFVGAALVLWPLAWLLVSQQAWLEAERLWLGAIMAAFALATIPLRVAFERPREVLDARGALHSYAVMMLIAPALAAGAFAAGALASRITDNFVAALFLAILFGAVAAFCIPVIVGAVRGRQPVASVVPKLLQNAGIAVLFVGGLGLIATLRGMNHDEPKTIVIPSPQLLDDLKGNPSIPLHTARVREPDGLFALHLQADGGDVNTTLRRLMAATFDAAKRLESDTSASGTLQLWLPRYLETPEAVGRAREEEQMLSQVLAEKKSGAGKPLRVVIGFGALPKASE